MARENDSIVYPEGKLFICRTLNGTGWEVRSPVGVTIVNEPTPKGAVKKVLTRNDAEGGVLEKGIGKGIDARVQAVKHAVTLGYMTEEQGAAQILKHKPAKVAK